jgi:hypothetical protein
MSEDSAHDDFSNALEVLAAAGFERMSTLYKNELAGLDILQGGEPLPESQGTYSYPVLIEFGVAVFGTVKITFYAPGTKTAIGEFNGISAGFGIAKGAVEGKAVLGYRVDEIKGWRATYAADFSPVTTLVTLTGMRLEAIGFAAGASLTLSSSVQLGTGKFS